MADQTVIKDEKKGWGLYGRERVPVGAPPSYLLLKDITEQEARDLVAGGWADDLYGTLTTGITPGAESLIKMTEELKKRGPGYAFALNGSDVLLIGPGSPYSITPTMFAVSDLQRAVEEGLLMRATSTLYGNGIHVSDHEIFVLANR